MKKFLTTAPVFAAIWFTVTAGILIEFNRFFPDLLFHPMLSAVAIKKAPIGAFFIAQRP